MGEMVEVLFACNSGENQSITAFNIQTGTTLFSYKGGGSIQKRSFNILRSEYLLAGNATKPLLHIWPINSYEQLSSVRFVLPGKADSFAIAPDGFFLVVGIQETIYIWNLTTGRLLNTICKHYQPITCIRFTDDASHFVSASRDGGVSVWNLTQTVTRDDDNQTALYTFNDHGLPVTDVHLGVGGLRCHMFTVSLDRTCKVYELITGTLLLNVVFAEALHSVIVNSMETSVYVGSAEGNIFEFNIGSAPRTKEHHVDQEVSNKFVGHNPGSPVNCLAISMDENVLVSGGQDANIYMWHIGSRQLLKTLQLKGPITNIELLSTHLAVFNPENKQPRVFCGNLKRMLDPPEADDYEEFEVLVNENTAPHLFSETYESEYVTPFSDYQSQSSASTVAQSKASTEELEKLRAEVQHLKNVNKQLFKAASKHILDKK